jgi:hypothetical protein
MIPPRPAFHEYEGKVLPSYKWLNDRQFCMSGDLQGEKTPPILAFFSSCRKYAKHSKLVASTPICRNVFFFLSIKIGYSVNM